MTKPDITDNLSDSYNLLKKDLKDKYAENIYEIIDNIKTEILSEASKIFGEELIEKIDEAESIKGDIDKIKKEFYAEEQYTSLQNKLKQQKDSLLTASESEADKITSEMKDTLDKVSTLNVTLKNRLKEKNEKLAEINAYLEGEFNKNKDILAKLKEDMFEKVKTDIVSCLDEFNEELSLLNETFGIEGKEPEIPFDENSIKMELPIFSYGSLFSDGEDGEEKQYIFSENTNTTKN